MKKEILIRCQGAVLVPYEMLVPFQGNLKDLSEKNYKKLKNQIIKLGFSEPFSVWIGEDGFHYLLNGHQRHRTIGKMIQEGFTCPPLPISLIQASSIEEAKKKVLALTSQYGEITGQGLYEFTVQSGMTPEEIKEAFRFPEINFKSWELNFFTDNTLPPGPNGGGEFGLPEDTVVRRGDIFELDTHRLMCGDATMIDDMESLTLGQNPDMVFYDPPYDEEDIYSAIPFLDNCNFLVMTQRKSIFQAMKACEDRGYEFKFDYVLYRKSPWLLSDKMPLVTHKNVFWYSKGEAPFDVKAKLFPWEKGEYKGDVKKVSCKNGEDYISSQDPNGKRLQSVFEFKMDDDKNHPHQKPILFMEFMVAIHSKELVLDMFAGSGSTLIACEKVKKRCLSMEIDEKYCHGIIERWQKFTGKKAYLIDVDGSKTPFDELAGCDIEAIG